MKIFGFFATVAQANIRDKLDQRHENFLTKVRGEGRNGFANRFDNKIKKAIRSIPEAHMFVKNCETAWPEDEDAEADAPFNEDSATTCQFGRKVARSYLRWVSNNLCLDDVPNATRKAKTIERKFDNVINLMWKDIYCADEEP
ncbi:Oidioi.mRNA.OKI2018_I69.PAR.g10003.t1.cds [Oikopleura dioica]|uniref:Oidioi.mRNA.OKI2018_I69.PAR.g10003.t1.cds n=1 Tax=Oikopleura dioica TaxID=34765 RepID=A0ABN7RUA2_OIKDI|nr:Oidioi.mRNA.OKI2018_I69.PAR.g10003.t1.cds [Oikopleura dioica]